ncbi:calcium-binding protein [Sedimentitalea sp. JM2-8]|uniref:Calcium-binding protein n=1 Tax=Sedimentitalea xiamensis TaxID=3050037 RepID=A0ABT7FG85_9RHOB|nr:calcium-binding protein [Sedimentitalea xiamensis]MDK3074154.1 calcium-binding protein [Sedimentitalea xiamensis]
MIITGDNQNNTLNGTIDDDIIEGLGGRDILSGRNGDDQMFGGGGNDTLRGGAGDNLFVGGAGDDSYILTGRYEQIEIGLGEDLVDLSNFTMGDGFVTLYAGASAQGIFAIIDGEEDFGVIRVDNGAGPEGLVFFENLNNALQLVPSKPEGGMQIIGTAYDDVFMIDTAEQGWIQITPGEGEDIIQIEGTAGTVRLDYSDMSDGIFANLKFGTIVDGGAGFSVDRIIGSGEVKQLRATSHDDIIYGGKGDTTFILEQGNDFLAAGRGIDTLRYDRSGVDAITVNLGSGSATGTWNGETFNHTFRGVENLRGSRDGGDKLIGSKADNYINGNGGRDVIEGKGGNDYLLGGSGADRFVFKNNSGNDVIGDFDAANNNEKIVLKGVSEITSFADLTANHMTEFTDGTIKQTYISDGAGVNITLEGILIADLDSGDFVF